MPIYRRIRPEGDHVDVDLAPEDGHGDVLEPVQRALAALDAAGQGFLIAEALVDDQGLGREPLPGPGELDQDVGLIDDRDSRWAGRNRSGRR